MPEEALGFLRLDGSESGKAYVRSPLGAGGAWQVGIPMFGTPVVADPRLGGAGAGPASSSQPPGETFPQLVSFFRILGVARKNAAFECLGAIWCDMERMVPDECMVLEKYPIGSLVYVLMPAQIYGLACIIDIRGSGIGREVKVRFFKSRSNLELPDAWILERSFRLELFSRYHQDDEIDVVP